MAAVYDSFAGTSGVLLSAHPADTGQSWLKFYSVGPSDDFALNGSATAGVAPNSANFTYYYVNDDVAVDVRVRATITRTTNPANSASSLILRYVDGANHYRIDFISNAVQIVRSTNVGTFQQPVIASATIAFPTNAPADVRVDLIGRTFTVYLNNVLALTYTDSNTLGDGLQASKKAGIGANNLTVFDNYSADPIGTTDNGGVFLRDRFINGTNATVTLLNHAPEVGPAWAATSGWGTLAEPRIMAATDADAQVLRGQSVSANAIYVSNQLMPSADVVITADIGRAATSTSCTVGFIFRADKTAMTGYYVRFAATTIGVYRYNNGALTTLATLNWTFPVSGAGNRFPIQIEMRGNQILVYAQGTLRIDTSDTVAPIAGPGYVGIYGEYYSYYKNMVARTASSVPATGTGSAAGTVAITGRGSRVLTGRGSAVGTTGGTPQGVTLKKGDNWPATTVSDSFTNPTGASQLLVNHLPEVGGNWFLMTGTANMSIPSGSSGKVASATADNNFYYNSAAKMVNSTVTATLSRANSGGWGGMTVRNNPATNSCYFVQYDSTSTTLGKWVNGVKSTLASASGGIGSNNAGHLCTLTIVDNHMVVTLDGAVTIDYIDAGNSLPNEGFPGIYAYSFPVAFDDYSVTVPVVIGTATASGSGVAAASGGRILNLTGTAAGVASSAVVPAITRTASFTNANNLGTAAGKGIVIKTMYGDAQGHSQAQAGGLTINYESATGAATGSTGGLARSLPIYNRVATASGSSTTNFTGRGFPSNEGDITLKAKSTAQASGVTIKAVQGIAVGTATSSVKTQLRRQGNGVAAGHSTAQAAGKGLLINGGDGIATGKGTAVGAGRSRRAATFAATGSSSAAGDGFPRFIAGKATSQGRATARVFNGPIVHASFNIAGTSTANSPFGGIVLTGVGYAPSGGVAYASAQSFKGIGQAAGTSTAQAIPATGELRFGAGHAAGTGTAIGHGEMVIGTIGTSVGISTAQAVGRSLQTRTVTATGTSTASADGVAIITGTATAQGTSQALGMGEASAQAVGHASGSTTLYGAGITIIQARATAFGLAASDAQSIAIDEATFSVSGSSTAQATGAGINFAVAVGRAAGTSTAWGTASVVPVDRTLNTSVKAQPLYWADEDQGQVRVDDWPNPSRDLKTVMMHTDDFVGIITVQASLHGVPGEDDWFDVHVETFMQAAMNEPKARNRFFNSRDRFIWMRVKIEKVAGRVDRIMVI